jgi:ketosteroid isomerase-like protein
MNPSISDAVRDLHARYADAVWRKDFTGFGECFTHDAHWRIGGLELHGRATITEAIARIMGNMDRVLITFQSPILDIAESRVTARTYMQEQVARKDGSRQIAIGRYYEIFVEEEGRWRFAWRLFQRHYSGPADLSGEFFEWDDYGPPPGMPPLDAPSGDYAGLKWGI